MSGRVDVQSRARRSYNAVVMPTDALLTLGMLKFTSLILEAVGTIAVMKEVVFRERSAPVFCRCYNYGYGNAIECSFCERSM